jgi:hypothetical protein
VTTYGFNNHTARSEQWRLIRYANGEEELYDEQKDPYEWSNLAALEKHAPVKAELARAFPASNHPAVSGEGGKGRRRLNKKARKDDAD